VRLGGAGCINIELPDRIATASDQLVRKGVLKETELDEMVEPMLRWKFLLGLFDDPYVDPEKPIASWLRRARALALEAARRSITLLKNEGGIAPLI